MAHNISKEEIMASIIELDQQHEQCIELGEELNGQVSTGKENTILLLTLANIIKMTREHFMKEESLMVNLRFPEYAQHKTEHNDFINDLLQFYNSIKGGEEPVTYEGINKICNWYFMHINEADAEFKTYLKNCA